VWKKPTPINDTGWLKIYRATVSGTSQGVVLNASRMQERS
jgi:dihydroxy-acid dehydratase